MPGEAGVPPDQVGGVPGGAVLAPSEAGAGLPAPGLVPLTWITSVENGKRRVYCDRCSREHLRSIEAKLDSEWW